MLQTRFYQRVGIFTNVVIDVFCGIFPFMWIILLVIVAFSHAFWIILSTSTSPEIPPYSFQNYWTSAKYTFLASTQDFSKFGDIDGINWFVDLLRAICFALACDSHFEPPGFCTGRRLAQRIRARRPRGTSDAVASSSKPLEVKRHRFALMAV